MSLLRTNINMRKHLHGLQYGDVYNIAYGHWIIYREMDLNNRSKYWRQDLGEAELGPKYEYNDFLIRTRRYRHGLAASSSNQGMLDVLEGLLEPTDWLYYVEYLPYKNCKTGEERPINVKVEDNIFEIKEHESVDVPSPPYNVTKKMDIRLIEPVLGDYGRIEYWIVVAKDSPNKY